MELASRVDDWHPDLLDPTGLRKPKPRKTGLTMVIDSGLGLTAFNDLLQTSGHYIDILKIGFGTSVLYSSELLRKKIELAKAHQVTIIPGGTFLELAVHKNRVDHWFEMVKQFGFSGIEVSDGTIEMSRKQRNRLIQKGIEFKFDVLSEYGKKFGGKLHQLDQLIQTVNEDLNLGAKLVTIEGRESGINAGLYDQNGSFRLDEINVIVERVSSSAQIMWETPLKTQQIDFLKKVGPEANLGNIAPNDVIALEALRRGLRSDTFPSK